MTFPNPIQAIRNWFIPPEPPEVDEAALEDAHEHNKDQPITILCDDVLRYIGEYLDNKEICNLMQTCEMLNKRVSRSCYWDLRLRMGRVINTAQIFQVFMSDPQEVVRANAILSARAIRSRHRTTERRELTRRVEGAKDYTKSDEFKNKAQMMDFIGDAISVPCTLYTGAMSAAALAGVRPQPLTDEQLDTYLNSSWD